MWPGGSEVRTLGGPVWIDDFEGHWPNVEDVDNDRLVEIRKKTAEAINGPTQILPPFLWYWEDQLQRIDVEMKRRGLHL